MGCLKLYHFLWVNTLVFILCTMYRMECLRSFFIFQGEKDMMKYELARKLHRCVDKIRAQYQEDWKSKEMRIRQRAVALYFIDKV